jgi:putative ABC transport system substrate-binding protein
MASFIRRRRFLATLGGSAVAWPLAVVAQQPARRPLVGVLSPITREAAAGNIQAFRQALGDLGYAEGENIAVEYRFAGGDKDALAALAAELVALKPDVIVVGSNDGILAVHKVTQTIPVVGVGLSFDLLNLGLIVSYAHPGGNVTGFYGAVAANLRGKRVSLLKEMAPRITRIGMVFNPDEVGVAFLARSLDELGRPLNLDIRLFPVRSVAQFETAFAAAEQERVDP